MTTLSRSQAAQIGKETVGFLRAGKYTNPAGRDVDLRPHLVAAVAGTVSYPPDVPLPAVVPGGRMTTFAVVNETTLDAARRFAAEGFRPVALNFASAKHAGGGFLGGARAQEESLCRASGLFACIEGNPMYDFHSQQGGGFYTNYAIYSPAVPVFRTDDGELLPEPYACAFVTAPAVNAGAVDFRQRSRIPGEMERRVAKVLAIMAGHGHDAVVLGAWGCGVFKNDPEVVADLFRDALAARFYGVFARVVFAVVDWSDDQHFIGPFAARFGAA
ncbi:TIGR02452 family protein [Fimbriiglobus ruber]|uniref:Microbial-type PARG catalytic domain-containing protein n=1 Tax=Fimbriiglobus ruber TaxID=1908690 RepID=A0A225DM50_9BACT|nr:TIGR02452 family protein [Fimbriiglobus ruber]OWK38556.1 hypothetical protein FRUB_07676 [Fimbriiglobus ruber]